MKIFEYRKQFEKELNCKSFEECECEEKMAYMFGFAQWLCNEIEKIKNK